MHILVVFILTCYYYFAFPRIAYANDASCPRRLIHFPGSIEEAQFQLRIYQNLLKRDALGAGAISTPVSRVFDPVEASIDHVHDALFRRNLTCRDIATAYIARIDVYNPTINAVITLSPTVLSDADYIDEGVAAGRFTLASHPLLCIPTLLKDNFDAVGMPTTAGSTAFADLWPTTDARTVRRLKAAGAVILGKTNMQEFALEGITVSSLGGQTRNPYDLTRTPGGSSGGSGAALAASFAVIATGSDTMNSLRSPASANSLVSLRPTRGLLSRAGVMPVSNTQDTVGPMARTVADLAAMYAVMLASEPDEEDESYHRNHSRSGRDGNDDKVDAATRLIPGTDPARSLVFSPPSDPLDSHLAGLRFGVLEPLFDWNYTGEDHEEMQVVNDVMAKFLSTLQHAGATLVPVQSPVLDFDSLSKLDVQRFETGDELNEYLASSSRKGSFPRTVAEVFDVTDNELAKGRRLCVEEYCKQPDIARCAGNESATENNCGVEDSTELSASCDKMIDHENGTWAINLQNIAINFTAPRKRSTADFLVLPHQYAHIAAVLSSSPRSSPHCKALYSSRIRAIEHLKKELTAIFTNPHKPDLSSCFANSDPMYLVSPLIESASSQDPSATSTSTTSSSYHPAAESSPSSALDFIIYPEQRHLVVPIGSPSQAGRNGHLAALTGFPVLTLPAGFSRRSHGDGASATSRFTSNYRISKEEQNAKETEAGQEEPGVPIGVEMLGRPGSEQALFHAAAIIERITRVRKPPPQLPCSLESDGGGADACEAAYRKRARRGYEKVPVIVPDTASIPSEYPLGVR